MGAWHLSAEDAMDARAIIFPYYVAIAKIGPFDNRVGRRCSGSHATSRCSRKMVELRNTAGKEMHAREAG